MVLQASAPRRNVTLPSLVKKMEQGEAIVQSGEKAKRKPAQSAA
jgi:hypothetical protein